MVVLVGPTQCLDVQMKEPDELRREGVLDMTLVVVVGLALLSELERCMQPVVEASKLHMPATMFKTT